MKKKYLLLFVTFFSILLGFSFSGKTVSAAPWGAKKLYTTPKKVRGTWYYKEDHKIKKWRITAHTSNGRKLYRMLPNRQYSKWQKKLYRLSDKKTLKVYDWLDHHMYQAYTFKWHGITSFNTNGWLAGAGDGVYYVPVKHYRKGRKVSALRFGGGAGNWIMFYAYKSRSLAK